MRVAQVVHLPWASGKPERLNENSRGPAHTLPRICQPVRLHENSRGQSGAPPTDSRTRMIYSTLKGSKKRLLLQYPRRYHAAMAQTLTRLLVHVVFSTKERRDLIAPAIEAELHAYLGGICRNRESPALVIGGTENHVHLLISLSKNMALSDLMMTLKKDSSKWIKTKGDAFRDFHWQDGYGAFSIGESQVRAATDYIRGQRERHKILSFEDELVALAERYGVLFDRRYLWT